MPCKDGPTPKGHYFLSAMNGEYDVTAICAQSHIIYEASNRKGKLTDLWLLFYRFFKRF